jgi:iron complex outermembrane receptor protein
MNIRLVLASGAAFGAIAFAAPAIAQEADPAADVATEDDNAIIVTARRQSETLQDVPASVTVLTAETLAVTGVQRADDFIGLTPGVTIVTGTAEAGDTQINIRGINGARDAESSVALVVDGILKTNTAQLNQNQGTLRQVEVLKGPQGALYGRNAAAGAIVLQTLKPGDALEAGVLVRGAEDNTYLATGYIATPIGDSAGLVLSGNYSTTDGFYRNRFLDNSKTIDDQETWGVDARFVADLGPATEIDVKARYAELTGASIAFNAAFHLPAFGGAFFEDVNDHPFGFYSNIRPTNEQQTFEASAKIEHQFEDMTLTAWALYSDVDQALTADGTSADFARFVDFSGEAGGDLGAASDACFASTAELTGYPLNPPAFIGNTPIPFIFDPVNGSTFGPYSPTTCDGTQYQIREQSDFSAEVRLASNGDGDFNWQVGAYYLKIDREVGVSLGADLGQGVTRQLYNAPGSTNPTTQLYNDAFKTDVYAVFGAADFDVSDRFNISVAGRYDIEDRRVNSLVPTVFDPFTGGPINPGQEVVGGVVQPIAPQSETFKQFQPKISLRYEITDDINLYGNWGIGFKSGGFNNQGAAAIVDSAFNDFIGTSILIEDQYRKEVSSAFEAGIKGSVLDGAVTFDLAGYYTNVEDMQFFEFFVGGFGLLRVVSNIDEVELYGAELNLTAQIIEGWKVFGSANVTDSEIKENASRPVTVGNKSPYTADYTINLGTQFDLPVGDTVNFVTRADYRITGPTWFHTMQDNTNPTLFSGLLPGSALGLPSFVGDADYSITQRDTFGVMDMRVGFDGGRWTAFVYAENLFDEEYLNEVIPAVEFGGSFISPGGLQRFGIELGYKF